MRALGAALLSSQGLAERGPFPLTCTEPRPQGLALQDAAVSLARRGSVLVLMGIELFFFLVAGIVLLFRIRIMLMQ